MPAKAARSPSVEPELRHLPGAVRAGAAATADRRAAGPASSARPAPQADAGEVPFSQWAPEEVRAWNLIPFRVVYANVGRAAAS